MATVIRRTTDDIDAELRSFEERYGKPSEKLTEAFRNSPLRETADFHRWSALYAARSALAGPVRR